MAQGDPITIQPQQAGDAPLGYELAPGQAMEVTVATAVFDGTAAAGSFVPTIAFYANNGRLIGKAPCGTTVGQGASAEVTFFPFVPPASSAGGSGLDNLIKSLRPAAWYKLNESLGQVAHDSSGNGFDASAGSLANAPTWDQPAGPPGTPSALFKSAPDKTHLRNAVFPDLSGGDLSASSWVFRQIDGLILAIGQGDALTTTNGWQLYVQGSTGLPHNVPTLGVVSGGVEYDLVADNPIIPGNWYQITTVLNSGTWSLFVNGVRQSTTLTKTPSSAVGVNLGQGDAGTIASDGLMEYSLLFNYALTDAQVLQLYHGA